MSFLNPVSEPVKRFKSTDAGAPQINYNARVSGDVKTVLKACLVTGYGAKASAGWSIVNEVDHVAEFVSPSAAMSDYRLGVDDSTGLKTTWYYQDQDVRVNPLKNELIKKPTVINSALPTSWELFVTARGFLIIETATYNKFSVTGSSVMYFGQIKSALESVNQKNMAWWATGFGSIAAAGNPAYFFSRENGADAQHISLSGISIDDNEVANGAAIKTYDLSMAHNYKLSLIDVVSEWAFCSGGERVAIQPGLSVQARIDVTSTTLPTADVDNRPVFWCWPTRGDDRYDYYILGASRAYFAVFLDYWEY